jgi:hypothetical protein
VQRTSTVTSASSTGPPSPETFNDAYTSPILYGPSTFGFITPIPPADWPADDRSVFAFHFEALRRAMATARTDIAAALPGA